MPFRATGYVIVKYGLYDHVTVFNAASAAILVLPATLSYKYLPILLETYKVIAKKPVKNIF